jgi:hypothetical protein
MPLEQHNCAWFRVGKRKSYYPVSKRAVKGGVFHVTSSAYYVTTSASALVYLPSLQPVLGHGLENAVQ